MEKHPMGYNKLLIPLDGSELAELALQHIPRIAAPHAHIHLLSVFSVEEPRIDLATIAITVGTEVPRSLVKPSEEVRVRKEYLERVAKNLEQKGYVVTIDVPSGQVVDTIAKVSQEGFEIVVMATHGRTGFTKFVLGSVAEGVLHKAHCPVFII
jgi:nucleotide-binding universal stress UspA family protein